MGGCAVLEEEIFLGDLGLVEVVLGMLCPVFPFNDGGLIFVATDRWVRKRL